MSKKASELVKRISATFEDSKSHKKNAAEAIALSEVSRVHGSVLIFQWLKMTEVPTRGKGVRKERKKARSFLEETLGLSERQFKDSWDCAGKMQAHRTIGKLDENKTRAFLAEVQVSNSVKGIAKMTHLKAYFGLKTGDSPIETIVKQLVGPLECRSMKDIEAITSSDTFEKVLKAAIKKAIKADAEAAAKAAA